MSFKSNVAFLLLFSGLLLAGCLGQSSSTTTTTLYQAPATTVTSTTFPSTTTTVPLPMSAPSDAGNVLVSDQFNNRVVELNRITGSVDWSFGSGNASLCNPGPNSVIGPNWAQRLDGGLTLIAATGIPVGADSLLPNGCVDNRVIIVNQTGSIVWQYGQANVSGSGSNELNAPVSAVQLSNGDILITDQGNARVIEVSRQGQIVWSYGPTSGSGMLNNPNSAEPLSNGDFLIADEGNSRVIEVNPTGNIVWQYSGSISGAAFASRLANNDTLITDTGNSLVFEVNSTGSIVWEFFTNSSVGSNVKPSPSNAVRLTNGDTMIADQFNDRVIEVNSVGVISWQYGETDNPGVGSGQLNAPYTAFVIGDYTGRAVPPA